MINKFIRRSRVQGMSPLWNKSHIIHDILQSRSLFAVQTIEYDYINVSCMDIDDTGNFLIAGLSNGSIDLQGIQDPTLGTMEFITRFTFSPHNIHRVQWNPGHEQFFSMLDNHNLYLVDPVEMRVIERFDFSLKTNWSEWNPSDRKMIAVCGSESQVRLVDIRSGSSVQTVILGAQSGLATHRATRCLWSKQDLSCLTVGDNEGYLHVYDTRQSSKPLVLAGEERGQISGMSFTSNQNSIITSQGSENTLVEWCYDKCSLIAKTNKFRKPEKPRKPAEGFMVEPQQGTTSRSKQPQLRKHTRRVIPLPVDAYIRCQFYLTDRHLYCPVPPTVTKSKELYIYDIQSGLRIKTLRSEDILRQGVFTVTGLLPDSLVLYVGGRGRLRVWSIDEAHQRKKEERMRQYHRTTWDSEDES